MRRLPLISKPLLTLAMLLGLLAIVAPVIAAEGGGDAEEASEAVDPAKIIQSPEAEDTFVAADTSSPRATLKSFLDACNELYRTVKAKGYLDRENDAAVATRILDCINDSELPAFARQDRASEVAVCLKEILDRHELPRWDQIPDVERIENAGGFEAFPRWRVPGTRITIARAESGHQKNEYLFSLGTVHRAVSYYRDVSSRPYRTTGPPTSPGLYKWYMSAPGHPSIGKVVTRLPERIRFGRTLGMTNWKWPGLMLSLALTIALMVLLYRLQLKWSAAARRKGPITYGLTALLPIAAMLTPLWFQYIVHRYLTVRGAPLYFTSFGADVVAILAAIVVVFVTCNRLAELIITKPSINPSGLDAQLIRIGAKLLSLALAVIVFIVGGQYLGFAVGTLLASAGIGGLALALGAQDTLKTLFGTIMLLADKPFRVGERVLFKHYDGVVEDIGLRSTRLRLLNGHQVTVPNDELARSDIENVGRRRFIRRIADFQFPLETPREKLEQALTRIRKQIQNHEGLDPEFPPRVFFTDVSSEAYAIRVIYWYHPPDYWDYLAFSESFNLAVLKSLEECGVRLKLPQRVTHATDENQPAPIEVRMVTGE